MLTPTIFRLPALFAAVALCLLPAAGFGQSCCLTPTLDSLVANLNSTLAVTNVSVQPGAGCDTFSVSWDFNTGQSTIIYTCAYKADSLSLREWHRYIIDGVPFGDTAMVTANWCKIAVEKGRLSIPGTGAITASPNPFRSEISFRFENPSGRAEISIFDVTGVRVIQIRNISGTTFSWKPANIRPGAYVVQVLARNSDYVKLISLVR